MSVKVRLSPEQQLRIFIESLKDNVKISDICRREEIWPRQYYRIKEKALSGTLEVLKNSRKKKDAEKERLKKEIGVGKDLLRIYCQSRQIALHTLLRGKGEFSTDKSHYPKYKRYSDTEYQEKYQVKMAEIGEYIDDEIGR